LAQLAVDRRQGLVAAHLAKLGLFIGTCLRRAICTLSGNRKTVTKTDPQYPYQMCHTGWYERMWGAQRALKGSFAQRERLENILCVGGRDWRGPYGKGNAQCSLNLAYFLFLKS
jgi:hypothetical protein